MQSLGFNSDKIVYVFLSDGGQFENLGVYELLKRRCGTIYSFDAGYDPDCNLESLYNLLRLSLDNQLIIGYRYDEVYSPFLFIPNAQKLTKGRIMKIYVEYPSGQIGVIWYVKSTMTESDDDPEILMHAKQEPNFPNDPTTNQIFSSSKFRAYHDLGKLSARQLLQVVSGQPITSSLARHIPSVFPPENNGKTETLNNNAGKADVSLASKDESATQENEKNDPTIVQDGLNTAVKNPKKKKKEKKTN